MDKSLAVGFLSFLSDEEEVRKVKRRMSNRIQFEGDSLQSEGNTFEPLLVYEGYIFKKRTTWTKYWGKCTLNGVLILKRKEKDHKIHRQYRLKYCSIVKKRGRHFQLLRKDKSPVKFRTTTTDQCNIWIPTLSVSFLLCSTFVSCELMIFYLSNIVRRCIHN